MPRWIVLAVLGVAAYFAWRKFGAQVTSAVTSVAK